MTPWTQCSTVFRVHVCCRGGTFLRPRLGYVGGRCVGREGAAGIRCRAGGPKVFGLPVIDPTPIGGLNIGPVAVAVVAVPV